MEIKQFMTEEKLWMMFKHFDVDDTNFISMENIMKAMGKMGKVVTQEIVDHTFAQHDLKKDGRLSFDEFKLIFTHEEGDVPDQHAQHGEVNNEMAELVNIIENCVDHPEPMGPPQVLAGVVVEDGDEDIYDAGVAPDGFQSDIFEAPVAAVAVAAESLEPILPVLAQVDGLTPLVFNENYLNYIKMERVEVKLPETWTSDKGKLNFMLHGCFSPQECKVLMQRTDERFTKEGTNQTSEKINGG